jgi:hypothetical protein
MRLGPKRACAVVADQRHRQITRLRPPPEQLTADLLRRMIAARVLEEAFGTLDRAALKLPQSRGTFVRQSVEENL